MTENAATSSDSNPESPIVTIVMTLWFALLVVSFIYHDMFPVAGCVLLSVIYLIFTLVRWTNQRGHGGWVIVALIGLALNGHRMMTSRTGPMASNAEYDYIQSLGPNVQVVKPVEGTPEDEDVIRAEFTYDTDCVATPKLNCPLSQRELDRLLDTPLDGGTIRQKSCYGTSADNAFTYIRARRDDEGRLLLADDSAWGSGIMMTVPIVRH